MMRHIVCFAGQTAVIESDSAVIDAFVPILFQHLLATVSTVADPPIIRAAYQPHSNLYQIDAPDQTIQETTNSSEFAINLLKTTTTYLFRQCDQGLLVHAAGLSKNGRGLLMPGESGQGKTTLTCWLLTQGFQFLSDESIYFSPDSGQMTPLTRPLVVKNRSMPIMQALRHHLPGKSNTRIIQHPSFALVPAENLSRQPIAKEATLSLILSPKFDPHSPYSLKPLGKSATVAVLMNNLFMTKDVPDKGFHTCVQLAKNIPAYELVYSDFSQLEGLIDTLWPR